MGHFIRKNQLITLPDAHSVQDLTQALQSYNGIGYSIPIFKILSARAGTPKTEVVESNKQTKQKTTEQS